MKTKRGVGRPPSPDGPKRHVAVYIPERLWPKIEKAAGQGSVSAWISALILRELRETE